jgi:hypothetical protein
MLRPSARIVASVDAPVHDVGGGRTSFASVQSIVPGLSSTTALASSNRSKTKAAGRSSSKEREVHTNS